MFGKTTAWMAMGILAAVLVGSAAVRAAEPTNRPAEQPNRIEQMRHTLGELNLTDSQRTQINGILDQAAQDAKNLREEFKNATPDQRRERLMAFGKQLREKVGAVLTAEQKTALREKFEARHGGEQGKGHGKGGHGPATRPTSRPTPGMVENRLKETLAKLDLTAEQKQKVDAILSDAKAQFEKLREERGQGHEANREKFRQIMEDMRTKIHDTLTPEQQKKLHEMMGPPPHGEHGQHHRQHEEPGAGGDK